MDQEGVTVQFPEQQRGKCAILNFTCLDAVRENQSQSRDDRV